MQEFLEKHRQKIAGVLEGFDRILFRGTLLSLSHPQGMGQFLGSQRVMYKDYKQFALRLSRRVVDHAEAAAMRAKRPFISLSSPAARKEEVARKIVERDGVQEGLICVLACVEPCQTISVRGNRTSKRLELRKERRQCLHVYFYYLDREFGLMHVRLQTWLPFGIQVCLNGREYLAVRMKKAGIGFEQRDNCFVRIDDLPRARRMLAELETRNWVKMLSALARRVNPWIGPGGELDIHGYYWGMRESEYATDVMFKDEAALRSIYPHLVSHAMKHFGCQDVLRFLGRRTNVRFSGEVCGDIQLRAEGMRIKHRVEENSIKMYDKQGSVLRVETTINNAKRFRVWRKCRRKGRRVMRWVAMRKGVADLPRRVDVCRAANGRYLQALGVVGEPSPTRLLLDPVSRPVVRDRRPYRALRPVSPQEAKLFAAVMNGRFLLQGFTNRDLRGELGLNHDRDPAARRRESGRITRLLRLLRVHGLIGKVSRTRYYRVSDQGRRVMTAALNIRDADASRLVA